MPYDAVRYLSEAQYAIEQRLIARALPPEEIERLEQMLRAISIMLDARVGEHTFH